MEQKKIQGKLCSGSQAGRAYLKSLFTLAMLAILIAACSHPKEEGLGCPVHHISKSEKLIIPAAVDLPANLPKGNTRIATYYAEGVQKYRGQLRPGSGPATLEWAFVAPEANLYDSTNAKIGIHFAGPAWQLARLSKDSIVGQQFSTPKSAPSPEPSSIDWLLLMPKTGILPTGVFSEVAYIQRISTKGGKAPARLPVKAGETIDVKYTAVYRFTKKNT